MTWVLPGTADLPRQRATRPRDILVQGGQAGHPGYQTQGSPSEYIYTRTYLLSGIDLPINYLPTCLLACMTTCLSSAYLPSGIHEDLSNICLNTYCQ